MSPPHIAPDITPPSNTLQSSLQRVFFFSSFPLTPALTPAFLGRPDLTTVLTKLHVFRLVQYSKIIFLDADVLPLRPLTHLFQLPHEFSAAPDVGWPDIFNSGVLVLSPGEDKFNELNDLLKFKGTWDGGDQGILNEWRGNNWNRLSFTYNTTPTAAYTYVPPPFVLPLSKFLMLIAVMPPLMSDLALKFLLSTSLGRTSRGTQLLIVPPLQQNLPPRRRQMVIPSSRHMTMILWSTVGTLSMISTTAPSPPPQLRRSALKNTLQHGMSQRRPGRRR